MQDSAQKIGKPPWETSINGGHINPISPNTQTYLGFQVPDSTLASPGRYEDSFSTTQMFKEPKADLV